METTGDDASCINENNERQKKKYTIWQDQALLIVINMQKNGAVQNKHQNKSIYEKSAVY